MLNENCIRLFLIIKLFSRYENKDNDFIFYGELGAKITSDKKKVGKQRIVFEKIIFIKFLNKKSRDSTF